MSMIACDYCGHLIDSDDDPDCFCDAPRIHPDSYKLDRVLCEPCRERELERQAERRSECLPDQRNAHVAEPFRSILNDFVTLSTKGR